MITVLKMIWHGITKITDNVTVTDTVNDNENDIDTNLLSNSEVEELQKVIIETLGSTNLTVIQEAIRYLDDLPLEVIKEALVRTARKQKKWDYARGTLNNWIGDGLDTLEKIKANDINFKNKDEPQEIKTDEFKAVDISDLTPEEYGLLMQKKITIEKLIEKGRVNVG